MIGDSPDTILNHPSLAGRTVYVRRGPQWESFVVLHEGGLTPAPHSAHPMAALSWRPTIGA